MPPGKTITTLKPKKKLTPPSKPQKILSIGFIGCGKMAEAHARVIAGLGHQLTAASARDNSPRLQPFVKKYDVSHSYTHWKDMLSKETLDALVVSTPWNETEKIASDVIKSGIPSLIEKPLALKSQTIQKIMTESQGSASHVWIGYNRRFYNSVEPVREALTKESLLSIELDLPEVAQFIRKTYSEAILPHLLVYMSSHWYDLLMSLVGKIQIKEVFTKMRSGESVAAAYNGLLWSDRYQVPVHLQSNFDAPSTIAMTFNFENRIYKLSPIEKCTVYKGMEKRTMKDGNNKYFPLVEREQEELGPTKPGLNFQMKNFIDGCVLGKTPKVKGCTLEDALDVTRLLESIQSVSQKY